MVGKGRIEGGGAAGIGADGFDADAQDIAIMRQKLRAFFHETWSVRAIVTEIDVAGGVGAIRPTGAQEQPGAARNAAVRGLPLLDAVDSEKEIGIRIDIPGDVDDAGWADELRGVDGINTVFGQVLTLDPVDGRVHVVA